MNRKLEVVPIILGMIGYAIFSLAGVGIIWMQNNKAKVLDFFAESGGSQNPSAEISEMLNGIGNQGWMMAIFLGVSVMAGLAALILIQKYQMKKAAGMTLLLTAVIVPFLTSGSGIIPGVFYLISGVACFIEKKEPHYIV
ncbi:DUF4064 domain-containing protein [Planococcus sp. MERTA32b]|nr:DUF4064 domain-containing protein [Planococcus sp. MER TA 32b]